MIDVAVIQSLVRRGTVDDCVANYGHLIVDECHHLSAQSFERLARQAKARFVTGLSATVARKELVTETLQWFDSVPWAGEISTGATSRRSPPSPCGARRFATCAFGPASGFQKWRRANALPEPDLR